MSSVMVVDDDRPLARSLAINLRADGYQVHLAHTGWTDAGDLGPPDLDGIEVLDAGELPIPARQRPRPRRRIYPTTNCESGPPAFTPPKPPRTC